jgi:hypothetical protein
MVIGALFPPADAGLAGLRAENGRGTPAGIRRYLPTAWEIPMNQSATPRRGGKADVPGEPQKKPNADAKERALEEALEESMAGSDPVSITQPGKDFVGGKNKK